jgi:anti-sigma-K factor RskA
MRVRRDDPHTLAGPYALNALSGPDQAAFERHLGDCDSCRQEAGGLFEAAARLGAATAAEPPPRLREQVLARAARTRQLPPLVPSTDGGGSMARSRTLGMPVARRMAVALAGVGMLVTLAVCGLVFHAQHRLHAVEAHGRAIATVLNAPDATMMSGQARNGGTATVVMSHADGALVLTTARLPALPAGERYQVWLIGPRGVRTAGLLPAPQQGMTPPVIVSGLGAGDKVGLTVEPAGGSGKPTTAPVLMLDLPS